MKPIAMAATISSARISQRAGGEVEGPASPPSALRDDDAMVVRIASVGTCAARGEMRGFLRFVPQCQNDR